MTWDHACPKCGTETVVHAPDCPHVGTEPTEFHACYIAVAAVLAHQGVRDLARGERPAVTFDALRDDVNDFYDDSSWSPLYEDCLHELKRQRWVVENDDGLVLTEVAERVGELVPTYDPVRTVYEHGPVDGAKDNAVFAMVSWCEMHDLDWEQTCAFVRRWLEETGGWERGDWAEDGIGQLLEAKRHVHRKGLGWLTRAQAAKRVIEDAGIEPALDADADAGTIEADDL